MSDSTGRRRCEQCGIMSYPHSSCHCVHCGLKHKHHLGCKYRAARVAAVEDQLQAGIHAAEIGQSVVRLPSGFVGSARWYQQLYYDAMALPIRFGKPDLFITMTCNPRWIEITSALPLGSHWKDHPEIIARVFMRKVRQFIKEMVQDEIFGVVLGYVYRIEWQVCISCCGL